jgi:hypothetical protein
LTGGKPFRHKKRELKSLALLLFLKTENQLSEKTMKQCFPPENKKADIWKKPLQESGTNSGAS